MYKSLRQKRRKDITSYLLRTVSVLCGHLIKHCKIDIFFLIRVCKIFYFLPRPAGPWQRRRLSSEVWGEEVHIWVLVKRGFLRLLGLFCFLKKKLKIEKGLIIPSLIWGHTDQNYNAKLLKCEAHYPILYNNIYHHKLLLPSNYAQKSKNSTYC